MVYKSVTVPSCLPVGRVAGDVFGDVGGQRYLLPNLDPGTISSVAPSLVKNYNSVQIKEIYRMECRALK